MLTIRLFLLTFIASQITYAAETKIFEVGHGSCWVNSPKEEFIKIASFNTNKSFSYNHEIFSDYADKIINSIMDNSYISNDSSVFLHCGGHGSSIVFSLVIEDKKICVWTTPQKEGFKFEHVVINWNLETEGCHGANPGGLIITFDKESQEIDEKIMMLLNDSENKLYIDNVERISFNIFKLILKKKYHYNEQVVKNHIEDFFIGDNSVKGVDYSYRDHLSGEFKEILKL